MSDRPVPQSPPRDNGAPAPQTAAPERTLARWVRDYADDLQRFLAKRRLIESDIKDVCQEVYLRILRFERSEVIEKPAAYLFRVAANVAHDFKLRQSQWTPLDDQTLDGLGDAPSTDQLADLEYRRRALLKAICTLPPLLRAAIALQTQEDLTYDDIARRLGVSHRVVKRAILRAHVLIREALARDV